MVQGRVPHAGAAHREAPQRHPFRIDFVSLFRERNRLENIGLSRPVIGILTAAEQIDLQRAGEIIDLCPLPGVEGLDFIETGKSSVLGDV